MSPFPHKREKAGLNVLRMAYMPISLKQRLPFRADLLLDAVVLVSGAVLPLAFAPYNWFLVAIVSPLILFVAWLNTTPGRAFVRGWLYGVGMFGAGVSWVYVSMHDFGGVPLGMSIFLTGIFVVFLALFPALLGYLISRFFSAATHTIKLLLIMPVAWVLAEWVRGWFLTGFPWLLLGYSQIDQPLGGLAPFLGVYGVSWAVALSSGLLIASILNSQWIYRIGCVAALIFLWGSSFALNNYTWTQPNGKPLKVSLIQGNIAQDIKWSPEMRDPTIDLYSTLTRDNWSSDLIIWPESALPDFYHEVDGYLEELGREAKANNSHLLIGVLYMDAKTEQYYNSVVSLGGGQPEFYHKRHLVPFTEYLPLKDAFGPIVKIMDVPMSDFSKGSDHQVPLSVGEQKVGIDVCYEDAFGEELIRALPQATFLVNVSNDAWFGESIAPAQHLQIARMRAKETGRPLLRGTNTGLTAIIDANGNVQSQAPQFQVQVLTGTIQPMRGSTVYTSVGNTLVVTGLFAVISWGWWLQRGRACRVRVA